MYRSGDGTIIATNREALEAHRVGWFIENKTVRTYCTKKEWDDWEEDLGELVASRDGVELRVGASIKLITSNGSLLIVHHCLIIGDRDHWQHYLMATREQREREFNESG